MLERAPRFDTQRLGKGRQQVRSAFDQHDARRFRTDAPEVVAQRMARDLRQRAGQLHAGRSAADDDECQQTPLCVGIDLPLGLFECEQHLPPHHERIVERLEAGRVLLPFRVAEVRVRRAARENHVVVSDRRRAVSGFGRTRDEYTSILWIDRRDIGEQHFDVLLSAQHPTDRRRDVAGRERRGRDLIQQRLKEMVVVPVEQRDADRRAGERARRVKPAETAADDDDAGSGFATRHARGAQSLSRGGTCDSGLGWIRHEKCYRTRYVLSSRACSRRARLGGGDGVSARLS